MVYTLGNSFNPMMKCFCPNNQCSHLNVLTFPTPDWVGAQKVKMRLDFSLTISMAKYENLHNKNKSCTGGKPMLYGHHFYSRAWVNQVRLSILLVVS